MPPHTIDWPKYHATVVKMLANGRSAAIIARQIPGATRDAIEGYIARNKLRLEKVAAPPKVSQTREETRGGSPTTIHLARAKTTRSITLEVSADVHAFLSDCATANGGEPEDIAASMPTDLARDTEASEAA